MQTMQKYTIKCQKKNCFSLQWAFQITEHIQYVHQSMHNFIVYLKLTINNLTNNTIIEKNIKNPQKSDFSALFA